MWHNGLGAIIVCSNDDPSMTLAYFTAKSDLVLVLKSDFRNNFETCCMTLFSLGYKIKSETVQANIKRRAFKTRIINEGE